ncbi:beta-galactosidase [Zhihengliuella halotolerans]|uniref:Beta-galactosidase n=1 Tax=Zhihengliuella halotolerans TaxID=370736 RepID=A0A4Q8AIA5_9MICC|nr:beta-galactosidase [Zhihengliuella halotolerans]RZU63651.1 beta-galactosidase [Zhihengliuella halotolerans]
MTEINRFANLIQRRGLLYGADYNPEQWPADVWPQDARLMRQAGVNLATVGVFSWARIEPAPGVRDFAWLDEVLDCLGSAGIGVDLATPTASPPPWLAEQHPSSLPVTEEGATLTVGSRNHFCPGDPAYRAAARSIASAVAERYAEHPAVEMWHVGNEYGQMCFCDRQAELFREWLRDRYSTLDQLNCAWDTTVWSQVYSAWSAINVPRAAPYHRNPAQALDWRRFCSDQLLDCYREQRDLIRDIDPVRPITTNFMEFFAHADYRDWAPHVDVVADDEYPDPADPHAASSTALTQDLMRSLRAGPWILMEQAASAVSWRGHNLVKSPARMRRDSLQAVARGADGVCFFQWRQALAGPERFHSSMLPHAGEDTEVHAGVRELGADLKSLAGTAGEHSAAHTGILWDWQSWWTATLPAQPTDQLDPLEQTRRWHRSLWRRGIATDVVAPDADLSGYRLLIAPALTALEGADADRLQAWVGSGGVLVTGPFTAVCDASTRIHAGRFPAPLAALLGASGEEYVPLPESGAGIRWTRAQYRAEYDPVLHLAEADRGSQPRAVVFAERFRTDGAEVLAEFDASDGGVAGAALTRNAVGDGAAWHLAAVTDQRTLDAVLAGAAADADLRRFDLPDGIEVVRRGRALFVLNHADVGRSVEPGELLAALGGETSPPVAHCLLTGQQVSAADGEIAVGRDDVLVLVPGRAPGTAENSRDEEVTQ